MTQRCKAYDCKAEIGAKFLMCEKHWLSVSMETRRAVVTAFIPGQQITGKISIDYVKAANRARYEVAVYENFSAHNLRRIRKAQKWTEQFWVQQEVEKLKKDFQYKA